MKERTKAQLSKTKMYEVFDHKAGGILPDYSETRAITEEGWLRVFYKCYPGVGRGVGLWNAVIREKGADIYDHQNNVVVTFVEVS